VSAVLLIARVQWRARWRSLLAVALVAGISGAVSLGAWRAAGRAGTSLDRLLAGTAATNLSVVAERPPDRQALERVARLPGVKAAGRFSLLMVAPELPGIRIGQDILVGAKTLQVGVSTEFPVVDGSAAHPARVDEVLVNEVGRDRFGLRVGRRVRLVSLTMDQFAKVDRGQDPGVPAGPVVLVTVVGITRSVQDVSDTPQSIVVVTPAYYDRYADRIAHLDTAGAYVDDQHLAAVGAGALDQELTAILGPMVQPPSVDDFSSRIRSALAVQVLGLHAFALIGAVAGLVAVGLMVSRHAAGSSTDRERRAAFGVTTSQERVAAASEFMPVAVLAAVITALGGALLAPEAITGLAARAEPDPGVWWDSSHLLAGAAAAAVGVLVFAVRAAKRRTTLRPNHGRQGPVVPIGGAGGPARRYGVRLAWPAGARARVAGGASAFCMAVGIGGVVAVATFTASRASLLTSPIAYGQDFQLSITSTSLVPLRQQQQWALDTIARMPSSVTEAVAISHQGPLTLIGPGGQVGLRAETVEPVLGDLSPVLRAGHPPHDADEVALGESSQRALGVGLGDRVTVGGTGKSLRVVGGYVLPDRDDTGEGALLTAAGFSTSVGPDALAALWIRLRPGLSVATGQAAFAAVDLAAVPLEAPSNVNNLNELGSVPVALATFLALLALAAVSHCLWSTVRRRRPDFAVLRALGFGRRQLRCVVRWAGLAVTAIGVAVGLPLGVVAGRQLWAGMSASLGVRDESSMAWSAVALAVPVTLLLVLAVTIPVGLTVTRRRTRNGYVSSERQDALRRACRAPPGVCQPNREREGAHPCAVPRQKIGWIHERGSCR
jgi:hypothetical protein